MFQPITTWTLHATTGVEYTTVAGIASGRTWKHVVRKPLDNRRHPLTPAQKQEIARRISEGESQRGLALEFGVSPTTITNVKHKFMGR